MTVGISWIEQLTLSNQWPFTQTWLASFLALSHVGKYVMPCYLFQSFTLVHTVLHFLCVKILCIFAWHQWVLCAIACDAKCYDRTLASDRLDVRTGWDVRLSFNSLYFRLSSQLTTLHMLIIVFAKNNEQYNLSSQTVITVQNASVFMVQDNINSAGVLFFGG